MPSSTNICPNKVPPTKSPTPLPVAPPVDVGGLVTGDDCTDLSDFTFKLDIGNRVKCSWLARHKQNAADRKAKYCGETHISSACQKSCDACTVEDASGGSVFKLNNMDTMLDVTG